MRPQRVLVVGSAGAGKTTIGKVLAARLDIRLARADMVVFPDVSRWLCLWRAVRRFYRHRSSQRDDIAPDCPEKIDTQFVRYILGFPKQHRPRLLDRLAHAQNVRVIHLRGQRAICDFLADPTIT